MEEDKRKRYTKEIRLSEEEKRYFGATVRKFMADKDTVKENPMLMWALWAEKVKLGGKHGFYNTPVACEKGPSLFEAGLKLLGDVGYINERMEITRESVTGAIAQATTSEKIVDLITILTTAYSWQTRDGIQDEVYDWVWIPKKEDDGRLITNQHKKDLGLLLEKYLPPK